MSPQPVDTFVASMHSLETQRARKVRILHFGDSHIASESESSVVRSYLQKLFGDGGPGLELPWCGPRLYTANFTYGNTYGWRRYHPTYSSPVADTGLSLAYVEGESPGQRAWIEAASSEFRVYFLAQPGGGDAEFLLDGTPVGQVMMNANEPQVRVARFQALQPDAPHRFEIRTLDSGAVRILGVSVEKAAAGVTYSALGLVGARAEYLLKCREETFEAQIGAEQPDLIIMGYGTNETGGSYLLENEYDTALTSIVSRLHRAAPAALVVFLTPPDRGDSRPGQAQKVEQILQKVMTVEREVAEREGAVVIDLHAAMGGPGAAERWASMQPPLAQADMTHFTNQGYNLLGRYIVGGIMKLYSTGGTTADPASSMDHERAGEILPPLYPEITGGALLTARSRDVYFPPPPASAQIFYFLKANGQVIVTNDLTTVDYGQGRLISPEEAGCLLRRKATPCDNATRW
jgi:lysophospholipase L1-like esterase